MFSPSPTVKMDQASSVKTTSGQDLASSGLAWKAHKEGFMKDLDKISNLTFRLSFGQTGNQGIGSYASLSKLNVYNYPFNGALQTGLADDVYSGPANASLKWETTTAYNERI